MPTKRKREPEEDSSTSTSLRRRIDIPNKPMCLVVEHKAEKPAAHSILTAGAMVPLHLSQRGMSFAAVDSPPHGSWIVGVGGVDHLHAIIYDPKTSQEWQGPFLNTVRMYPVLIPLRGDLYVLSRRPSVKPGAILLDFLPWFERISFKDGRPSNTTSYGHLEPPPVFPCRINPMEYNDPPAVRVASYAAVGSHILISVELDNVTAAGKVDRKYVGTCGYDVERKAWEMVHEMNLPFAGRAVPLGEQLFLGRSKVRDGAAAVYSMGVFRSASTGTNELSVTEVQVVVPKGRIVLGELLFPLERGRFSSVCVQSDDDPGPKSKLSKASVVHRTYCMVGYNAETNSVVILKQKRQVYKLVDRSSPLAHPSPVVAAFAM